MRVIYMAEARGYILTIGVKKHARPGHVSERTGSVSVGVNVKKHARPGELLGACRQTSMEIESGLRDLMNAASLDPWTRQVSLPAGRRRLEVYLLE